MKCLRHNLDAAGVCVWCGRAVCSECIGASIPPRLTCSESCIAAVAGQKQALELLLEKSRQTARANSVYYYICGGLSAGATIAAWYWLPSPLLMWFTGASAAGLIFSGAWYGRVARKKNL